jgi:hypothetical protein
LYEKKTKKIKPSDILNIVKIISKYPQDKIQQFKNLLLNGKVQITKSFFENYEDIIPKLMEKIYLIKIEKTVSLHDIYAIVSEKEILEMVNVVFPDELVDFVNEYRGKTYFGDIMFVGKFLQLKINSELIDFFLDLLANEKVSSFKDFLILLKYNLKLELSKKEADVIYLFASLDEKKLLNDFIKEYQNTHIDLPSDLVWNVLNEVVAGKESVNFLKQIVFIDDNTQVEVSSESSHK